MSDPRRTVFDAIRAARGDKAFTIDEVVEVDAVLTKLGVPHASDEGSRHTNRAAPDDTGRLTPNFTLAEMTHSQTASRKGIRNDPSEDEIKALKLLCERVLEPVRAHYGKPVIISSGYRSPRLNTAIGGSSSSQHCKGEAADFTVAGESNVEVAQWMHRNLDYDQLILEFPPGGWVHCSFSAHRTRNVELTAKRIGGRTRYLTGIRP